jgi:hypothetical protein
MSHPQMTAMIATQHCRDMQRLSAQGRRAVQAHGHGVRVRTTPSAARRSVWSGLAAALGKPAPATASTGRGTAARKRELKPA